MSLLTTLKADQLQARKDRNSVKATLLTTLITEVTTGLSAALYTEASNKVNRQANIEKWESSKLDEAINKLAAEFNKDWAPSEEQILNMIGKFVKNARGNLSVHQERGETDKADAVQHEIDILTSYLPKQLTEGELTEIISDFRAANPGTNIGAIMKHLQTEYKGLYDSKVASDLAKG